jgi:hypothetical protein
MEVEVNQFVGEGDEEEEFEEPKQKNPEEELESVLENFKHTEIASLHLQIHELVQQQQSCAKFSEPLLPNLNKIDIYLAKIKQLAKRKKNLEKKAQSIKNRFRNVMNIIKGVNK